MTTPRSSIHLRMFVLEIFSFSNISELLIQTSRTLPLIEESSPLQVGAFSTERSVGSTTMNSSNILTTKSDQTILFLMGNLPTLEISTRQ